MSVIFPANFEKIRKKHLFVGLQRFFLKAGCVELRRWCWPVKHGGVE